MKRVLLRLFSGTRCDRLVWRLDKSRLRILAYHGVCEDQLAREAWVPAYFVKRSAFEAQLSYLQRHAAMLRLSEAIARLRNNDLPDRCVCLTFDDGYANTLHVAYPLLEKYRMPATIFLATAYVESGDFLPFDRLRLIQSGRGRSSDSGSSADDPLMGYRTKPLDLVLELASQEWNRVKPQVSQDQRESLRPLRAEELQRFDSRLIEFGAHSHTHCILSNETPARREAEIMVSVQSVRRWTGRPVRVFSYPNGQPRDFGERDKEVLRSQGIEAAVTTISGANRHGCDLFELHRYPVGLYHDGDAFAAEVAGFRKALKFLVWRRGAHED